MSRFRHCRVYRGESCTLILQIIVRLFAARGAGHVLGRPLPKRQPCFSQIVDSYLMLMRVAVNNYNQSAPTPRIFLLASACGAHSPLTLRAATAREVLS